MPTNEQMPTNKVNEQAEALANRSAAEHWPDAGRTELGYGACRAERRNGYIEGYIAGHSSRDAEVKALRDALTAIVAHQKITGGGLAILSATARIAKDALNKSH